MTIKELQEILSKHPDNMDVKVALRRSISDITKVSTGVDINTNIVSLWLWGEE